MKKILLLLLFSSITFAQTIQTTISGVVSEKGTTNKLAAHLVFSQYDPVSTNWVLKDSTVAGSNGSFTKVLNNITGVDDVKIASPVKYSLFGNFISVPKTTNAYITYFDVTGKQVGNKVEVNLYKGNNKLNVNNIIMSANGVYFRSVEVNGQLLTQKLMKLGNAVNFALSGINTFSAKKFSSVKKPNGLSKGKSFSADSVYIMTIASLAGFNPDTTISAIYQYASSANLTVNPTLEKIVVNKNYTFDFSVTDLLEAKRNNIEVTLTNSTNLNDKYVSTSDVNGNAHFAMTDVNPNDKYVLTFKDLNDTTTSKYIDKKD